MPATAGRTRGDYGSAQDMFNITPNDGADLPNVISALSVQVPGNVHFLTESGADRTVALPAGFFPVRISKVFATGTTATGLVGFV